MAPDVEILCAFPSDAGTGGHKNGRCDSPEREEVGGGLDGWGGSPPYVGKTLKDALTQQYDGSYLATHHGASGYNEIVVGSMWWEANLPWAIEAFIFSNSGWDTNQLETLTVEMKIAHRNFLQYYGLSDDEVPLTRFHCSQVSAHDTINKLS